MHSALQLPEILAIVFDELQYDKQSLHSAMLVNVAWADLASRILWIQPPVGALVKLPADRRQHYASLARRLKIYGLFD